MNTCIKYALAVSEATVDRARRGHPLPSLRETRPKSTATSPPTRSLMPHHALDPSKVLLMNSQEIGLVQSRLGVNAHPQPLLRFSLYLSKIEHFPANVWNHLRSLVLKLIDRFVQKTHHHPQVSRTSRGTRRTMMRVHREERDI